MQNSTDDFLDNYISRKLGYLEGWARRLEREVAALKAINEMKENVSPTPKKQKVEQLRFLG